MSSLKEYNKDEEGEMEKQNSSLKEQPK